MAAGPYPKAGSRIAGCRSPCRNPARTEGGDERAGGSRRLLTERERERAGERPGAVSDRALLEVRDGGVERSVLEVDAPAQLSSTTMLGPSCALRVTSTPCCSASDCILA